MRQPSIGRLIALLTGATVVLLLTIDTTMACRFLMRHRYCSPYPPVAACRVAPPDCCGEVVVSGPESYGQPVESCCVAGEIVVGEQVIEGHVIEGHVIQAEPTPAVAPDVDAAADISEVPDAPTTPAPMPGDLDVAPADGGVVEPAIVEEPAEDSVPSFDETPADLPADELPADDLPTDDLPADDLFGAPVEEAPADDVFEEPAVDAPADQPADDLFNAAPADDMPTDDLDVFDEPATDTPADDLFGAPTDAPAAEGGDLPGFDEPLPSDEPLDAAPTEEGEDADSLDDLFGTTSNTSDMEPRTASANDVPAGDLFEGLDAPTEDAAPAADELFDTPTEAPVQEKDSTVDDLDDLFGARPTRPTAEPSQATKPVTDTTVELPVRLWTDNTGRFQTVGRLVKVSPTHIRLLKDNGRFSTVPKQRLSEADLNYVQDVTQQMGVEYFDQVASR